MAYTTVVVTSVREETPNVKTFTVARQDGSPIPYEAGQFITLVFTHHGREERRSFSISSAMGEPLAFTVRRLENGAYSRYLADRVTAGATLLTTGAAGLFTLPGEDTGYQQVFFLAAGIGITPVISLIKTLLHTRPGKKAVLIYSNRSRQDVVFHNELQQLAADFPGRLRLELLYSTSFNLMRARLNKELLPALISEYAEAPKEQLLFYICEPFGYMRMAAISLEEQGMHSSQVRKENFNTNDRHTTPAEPPDKCTHEVTLTHGSHSWHFPVVYPQTVLQAAKKQGISLPYSCEVGRCGSCAAICTQGEVWLSYNEVLMDSDIKKGMILTCVAHPVNGDVTIDLPANS